jgi:hypothetical protein
VTKITELSPFRLRDRNASPSELLATGCQEGWLVVSSEHGRDPTFCPAPLTADLLQIAEPRRQWPWEILKAKPQLTEHPHHTNESGHTAVETQQVRTELRQVPKEGLCRCLVNGYEFSSPGTEENLSLYSRAGGILLLDRLLPTFRLTCGRFGAPWTDQCERAVRCETHPRLAESVPAV